MIVSHCEFITSAVEQNQYPDTILPEFAFSGRSNVGKSSLINSLLNRKNLVRVSSSPGKTRLINFYLVNEKYMLVDLPGYGYAAVSKTEKAKWGEMIENYLKFRDNLVNTVLLVDIRHQPTEDDKLMYDFIKYYRGSVIVVATKLDKIGKNTVNKNLDIIKRTLGVDHSDRIIPYSSLNHWGREELWDVLTENLE